LNSAFGHVKQVGQCCASIANAESDKAVNSFRINGKRLILLIRFFKRVLLREIFAESDKAVNSFRIKGKRLILVIRFFKRVLLREIFKFEIQAGMCIDLPAERLL
jgi:hypothetical protein